MRAVDFAEEYGVKFKLAYYLPYTKYDPVERTHRVLEQYCSGMLLTDVETTINIAANMKWKGKHPVLKTIYEKGVKLTRKAMTVYEKMINRLPGLEKWFVAINSSRIRLWVI